MIPVTHAHGGRYRLPSGRFVARRRVTINANGAAAILESFWRKPEPEPVPVLELIGRRVRAMGRRR